MSRQRCAAGAECNERSSVGHLGHLACSSLYRGLQGSQEHTAGLHSGQPRLGSAPGPQAAPPKATQLLPAAPWSSSIVIQSSHRPCAMEQPAAAPAARAAPSLLTHLPPELLQHCFSFLDDGSKCAIDSRFLAVWHGCWVT